MNSGVIEQYQRVVAQLNENSAANDNGGGGGAGSASRTTSSSAVDSPLPLRYSHLRSSAVFDGADHETVQKLFAQLPFAATRSGEELHPTRAALSDALRENNREAEADLAGDPSKNLRPVYDNHESGWHLDESDAVDPSSATTAHLPSNVRHYLDTAVWSSSDADGNPIDGDSVYDFTPDAMERAHHDVHRFYSMLSPKALVAVYSDEDRAAHDLWLTRNGHGVDFRDGDWDHHGDDVVEELNNAAKKLGDQEVEVEHHGDSDPERDGEYTLHLHGGR